MHDAKDFSSPQINTPAAHRNDITFYNIG